MLIKNNKETYQELIDFLIGKPRASIVRIPRETFNKIKAIRDGLNSPIIDNGRSLGFKFVVIKSRYKKFNIVKE